MKWMCWLVLLLLAVVPASAEEYAMFNYSGRVRVQGSQFDGQGHFKFAIVNNPGNVTLWSNDGSSMGGSQPTAGIPVDVVDGIASVMVGDPATGMQPISRTVFNHPNRIKLRVWFDDGVRGFQRLLPDMNLVNVELLGWSSGTADIHLYVDAVNGSDENDGLTTDTAKLTIQAAVDVLPQRLNANATIKVFPGTYPEEVLLYGFSVRPGKQFLIVGDEEWTRTSPGEPSVRVTGALDPDNPAIGRGQGFLLSDSDNVTIKGFLIDYAVAGVGFNKANSTVRSCMIENCGTGVRVVSSYSYVRDSNLSGNVLNGPDGGFGIYVRPQGYVYVDGLIADDNESVGIYLVEGVAEIAGECSLSGNTRYGAALSSTSRLDFRPSFSGSVADNGWGGIEIRLNSFTRNHTRATFSNNGGGGTTHFVINTGGAMYDP